MAVVTGAAGTIQVDAGDVTEITGWSFDESANVISNTNLNDAAESNVAGRTSWSGSIEVMWDKANTGGQGVLLIGASVAVEFRPEGDTPALPEYQGTAIVTGRSQSVSDEAVISQTFTLQGTGALVLGTVSA